jgi:anti-sigma-K factor RskA
MVDVLMWRVDLRAARELTGATPIPAGLFKPDASGNAQMLYAELPPGAVAKGFAVTVEPRQGSPAPTTSPLLVGLVKS